MRCRAASEAEAHQKYKNEWIHLGIGFVPEAKLAEVMLEV
jgi:hypothetical protein